MEEMGGGGGGGRNNGRNDAADFVSVSEDARLYRFPSLYFLPFKLFIACLFAFPLFIIVHLFLLLPLSIILLLLFLQ